MLLRRRSRLPHALLVHGAPGTGVPEFALELARCLLCEQPEEGGRACGRCAACNWFAQANHPDFRLVQPDSFGATGEDDESPEPSAGRKAPEKKSEQIRIEQVRALQDFLAVGAHRAGARVVLLHPADAMNQPTQNALLKSLEEPGGGVVFILATSQPDRLLPTVRSRCSAVALPRPGRAEALAWLREQGVEDGEVLLALAGGAPVTAAALAGERKVAEQLADRLGERGFDPVAAAASLYTSPPLEVATALYRWCYDLLCVRLGAGARYHPARREALGRIARSADPVALAACLRALCEARALAQHPLNARLFVEDLLMRYARACGAA